MTQRLDAAFVLGLLSSSFGVGLHSGWPLALVWFGSVLMVSATAAAIREGNRQ